MTAVRRFTACVGIGSGLALAAEIYGSHRAAIIVLVNVVLALAVAVALLSAAINLEKRS